MSDDRTERLVAYLLGELDAAQRAAVEDELRRDPALRAEHDALAPVVTRLEAVPDAVWEALPQAAVPPPPPAPVAPSARDRARPRWWTRRLVLRPLAAGLAALVLLGAGTAIGLLAGDRSDGPTTVTQAQAARLTLQPIGTAGPAAGGRVAVGAGDHAAQLHVRGLAPQPGHFYELWLLDPDGKMVALGSFRVDARGDAVVRVPLPVDPARYRYFDVSLQPDSGDPAHSGISVLRGSTRS